MRFVKPIWGLTNLRAPRAACPSVPFGQVKLFILLTSQIENFGLTGSAKGVSKGTKGQWSTKKCRGT